MEKHFKNTVVFLFPVICSQLPISRTFFNFPWRFELSGVDCIFNKKLGKYRYMLKMLKFLIFVGRELKSTDLQGTIW